MEQLTAHQLAEWEEYNKLDPIGEWRNDHRLAYICNIISNLAISIHAKKGTKMTDIKDFMIEWDKPIIQGADKATQSVEDMKKAMLGIASTQNKKMKNKTKPPKMLNK